jgi:hypothetical protein
MTRFTREIVQGFTFELWVHAGLTALRKDVHVL